MENFFSGFQWSEPFTYLFKCNLSISKMRNKKKSTKFSGETLLIGDNES